MTGCGRKLLISLEIDDGPAVEAGYLVPEGEVQYAFGYASVIEDQ